MRRLAAIVLLPQVHLVQYGAGLAPRSLECQAGVPYGDLYSAAIAATTPLNHAV